MFNYHHSIIQKYPSGRLLSIDALRGFFIAAMIIVNTPGSWDFVYAPLLHASWNGWTPTDVIFPGFLFIVGISIVLSMQHKIPSADQYRRIVTRSLKLFGLGLLIAVFYYPLGVDNYPWWQEQVEQVRIMGVLQRIALVYAACALIVFHFNTMGWLLFAVALPTIYWALMLYAPFDVMGLEFTGTLIHGTNYAAYIDDLVLGRDHVYFDQILPFAYDPEGLLSTLPAISSGLLGALAGKLIVNRGAASFPVLAIGGALLTVIGLYLDELIPINKTLWTPSYVVLMAGISMILTAAAILFIDGLAFKKPVASFLVAGSNATAFYVLSALLTRLFIMIPIAETSLQGWLYGEVFQPAFGNYGGSLAFAIAFLVLCYIPIYWMFRRGIFWRV